MNNTCLDSLLWTQTLIGNTKSLLCVCTVAVISNLLFWLQIIFFSPLRRKSLHWIYGYMITDILLLTRFLFSYIIHTVSTQCEINRSWLLFNCYLEATADNYLNILEPYILLALNICRYIQIVYNRNVYELHSKYLIIIHLSIYLIPVLIFVSEFLLGWTQVEEVILTNCFISYTNIYAQVLNIVFGFALPISLNILVIDASLRYVHLVAALRRVQHRNSARDKYQRSLAIQFLFFYSIRLALWSPYVIASEISTNSSKVVSNAALVSLIEITLDPIITGALDVHFLKLWRKAWIQIKNVGHLDPPNTHRIQPTPTHLHIIALRN